MFALIPVLGTTFATIFSASLLTLPAVLGVRRFLAARLQAPFARDNLERQLVLASSLAGAAGAVLWADVMALVGSGGSEFAGLILGFMAPVPLGAVPWVAGELLSGVSQRRWRGLASAVATSCVLGWTSFALCFASRGLSLSPAIGLIQLAACIVSGLGAAHTYLAVRGEPVETLPLQAIALEHL